MTETRLNLRIISHTTPPYMDQHPESTVTTTTTTTAEWSKLPSEILQHLVKFIDLTLDLPRIRGVCSNWRTSLPLNQFPKPPSHFRIPNILYPVPPFDVLLIQSRFYLISPLADPTTAPWLVKIAETGLNKWHLLNPFNVDDYFHSDPPITTGINLLDFRVVELAKPWSIQAVTGKGKTLSKKVVGGWNLNASYVFAVLAQLDAGPLRIGGGGLMFKRIHDPEWVRIKGTFDEDGYFSEYRILDITYHNGLFYAFELVNWKVGVIDPSATEIWCFKFMDAPDIEPKRIGDYSLLSIDGGSYYLNNVSLVPASNELYLVIATTKKRSKKPTLFVFVLKQGDTIEEHKWERVKSLGAGGEILFIGYDVSFGVSSTILPNWKPGSICTFLDPHPLLMYDGCTSTFQGLPEGGERLKIISYPEYWRHLKMYDMEEEGRRMVRVEELGLFFPPPAWVKWRCPSLDNIEFRLHNLKFSRFKKTDDFSDVDSDESTD